MNNLPFVTVIIPCLNEERFISECLDSIIANDYPKESLEILVVDGNSEDKTREIAGAYTKRYSFIKLLDNPKKIIPSAMNIGIENSHGEIIMKIDSHAIYPMDYISKCIRFLKEYNADNVGGIIITYPRRETLIGKAIVNALSHKFGVGNSRFRLGCREPIWSETVFSGCYRRDVFDRVGLYDENIARSEDVAINSKLRKSGGRILLVPEIKTVYFARSNLNDFVKHNFDNGFWITYPLKFGRIVFSLRHLMPFIFVTVMIGFMILSFFSKVFMSMFLFVAVSYLLASVYFSFKIVFIQKDIRYLFIMPVIFTVLHTSYGTGSLWGFIKLLIPISLLKSKRFKDCHGI